MTRKKGSWKYVLAAGLVLGGTLALPGARAAADKTYEQLKILVDILDLIRENYVDDVDTTKLIYGAAAGMVRTLDRFSEFMEPDISKELKNETEGQFGGLGIRLGSKEGWPSVITPLPGTPAYRLGILPNDRIVKVNGQTTRDVPLFDVANKLKGPPGSKVSITIAREPDAAGKEWTTHDFTIVREVIRIESVYSRMLGGGVGYVRLAEFSATTPRDFSAALSDLKKHGMASLVLDLRNNPGGLLSAAVEIASDFIGDNKLIVYTQGRLPETRQDFRANARAPYASLPLVVLVNGGSASGSEIVAGAFQDLRRAVVVGERTFGKASVQQVIPLSDGSALRLTVGRYYTPLGRSLHIDEKTGVGGTMPDIVVPVSRETAVKLQVQEAEIFTPGKKPESAAKPEERVKDEVLDRALEILKAREVLSTLKT